MRPSKYDDPIRFPQFNDSKLARRMVLVMVWMIALLAALGTLGGCTVNRTVDWQAVHATLLEADSTAYDFQLALGETPLGEKIAVYRDAAAPVLEAVRLRAQDPNAADPSGAINSLLSMGTTLVTTIDDDGQRRTGLAVLASIRLALRVAGLST